MSVAYVLINSDLGSETDIISNLKEIEEVKEVHGVFGAYDILAKVISDDIKQLKEIITWKIRKIPKIKTTLTLMSTDR